MRDERRGVVLLESLIALTVLSVIAASTVMLLKQSSSGVISAELNQREYERASDLLEIASLWPIGDLDRHLGDKREGNFRLRISSQSPGLYGITVTDSTGRRALMATTVYRRLPKARSE